MRRLGGLVPQRGSRHVSRSRSPVVLGGEIIECARGRALPSPLSLSGMCLTPRTVRLDTVSLPDFVHGQLYRQRMRGSLRACKGVDPKIAGRPLLRPCRALYVCDLVQREGSAWKVLEAWRRDVRAATAAN